MGVNFAFQIVSPKYGTFTVIAPERFRAEIEAKTWSIHKNRNRAPGRNFEAVASVLHRNGKRMHNGKQMQRFTLYLSRFVWSLIGNPPVNEIDHRDGQPLNNAEDNLRDGTGRNQQNCRGLRRSNSSGFTGVSWHKHSEMWRAEICVNDKRIYLGLFADPKLAAQARDRAAIKYHGEFAALNWLA